MLKILKITHTLILTLIFLLSAFFLKSQAKVFSTSKDEFLKIAKKEFDSSNIQYFENDTIRATWVETEPTSKKFIIISSDYIKEYGYQGNTDLAIIFNQNGNIEYVKILKSEDTPFFVRKIQNSDFLDQFKNFTKDFEIDAISGATITSNAITRSMIKINKIITLILKQVK